MIFNAYIHVIAGLRAGHPSVPRLVSWL